MIIAVLTPDNDGKSRQALTPLQREGFDTTLVFPGEEDGCDTLEEKVSGLFVTGGGEFLPSDWSPVHMALLEQALARDLPVLATGSGLHLLNEAFGGSPPQPVEGHRSTDGDGDKVASHSIYLSPGSKTAAVMGQGGFFKVKSRHSVGLRERDRSPRLLASAYSTEDGVIEGLESTEHSWVLGFQANIECLGEAPRPFDSLFLGFLERAQDVSKAGSARGGKDPDQTS